MISTPAESFTTPECAWRAMSRSLTVTRKHIASQAHSASDLVARNSRSEALGLLKEHPPASFQELMLATLFDLRLHPKIFQVGLEGQTLHPPTKGVSTRMVFAEPISKGASKDPVWYKNYRLDDVVSHCEDLCNFLYNLFEYHQGVMTTFWWSHGVLWGACADYSAAEGGLQIAPVPALEISTERQFCILRSEYIVDGL